MIAASALSAVVGLVLLIACFNLANMLLARAATREKEMSIRAALGAGRLRLIRQLSTESLMLATAGGIAGLAIAVWGAKFLWSFRPSFLSAGSIDLKLDPRVLIFTAALTLVTGLIFGIVPAIRASRPQVNEILKSGGRGNTSSMSATLRGALVVGQIALTVVALACAGLFIRSMQKAQRIDPGFETHNLFSFGMDLSTLRWTPDHAREFELALARRLSELPGVESVAISANPPIGGGVMRTILTPEQAAEPNPRGTLTVLNAISPEFFATLNIPLHQGRAFTDFDRQDTTPVIVINEAAARVFFPGERAIGKRLKMLGDSYVSEVVGVAADTAVFAIGETPQPVIYQPLAQAPTPLVAIDVRTKTAPEPVLSASLGEAHRMNARLALVAPQTVQGLIGIGLWAPRMGAALFGIFGALGLLLAAIGLYGVMAYTVAQRTNEIGIRMALGAARPDVLGMVIGQGMRLTAFGVVAGLAASLAVTRLMATLLFGISPADPLTFTAVSVVLVIAAFAATSIPAWRAASIDPVIALRD
jgi:predicted permease